MSSSLFHSRPRVAPEFLRRRIRLIPTIAILAASTFALSDPFLFPQEIPALWSIKLGMVVMEGLALLALRQARSADAMILIGILALFAAMAASAVSGIITDGDGVSTQLLCTASMLTTALGIPWGGRAQALAGAGVFLAMVTNSAIVGAFGYPFVTALATIVASVYIAARLRAGHELRQALHENLAANERFLRNITDQLPVLIAYVDTDERYRFVNRAQVEWARREARDIIGRRVSDIASPEMQAILAPHIHTALSGKRCTFELDALSPAGEPRCLTAVLEPDIGSDGGVRGFFCLLSDITDRRHAEESARRQQAELAHVLRVSTMGEMTAALAHELNQPLAAIAAYAATCSAWAAAGPSAAAEVRESANFVAAEALRAGEIIRRLERLVRKVAPRCEVVAPADIIAHAVALVRAEARSAGVRVDSAISAELPLVYVDTIQIEQVLINLLLNAIQALERSDVPAPEIRITATALAERGLRIVIRDNGPGIEPEIRHAVFEPYFTTRPEGLGMGLTISRSIIETHSGKLLIGDDDGNAAGATVVIELPEARPGAAGDAGDATA